MSSGKMETRSVLDEIRGLNDRWLFDLGHPFLNRIAESFVKAAGIGAMQAFTREAYTAGVEGAGSHPGFSDIADKNRISGLKGENCKKSLEAMVKTTGRESLQWGMAAGVYSGLTYGFREARGTHDWKNSAVAGAIAGAAVALTSDQASRERIVQCAITGAALSTAAKLLAGVL
ncbi:outer envelope pore protein 16-2, chloroplastic [Zingiber officinale]|uniref:outer envelope pore protein 16-2, chloroplastic n=1 Tax=Zingiber officinale TaxID=94328 RepID=UPI001C4CC1AC|nr:outer envelope pore protein 16-2, chloroplastic [Zingiber officinale]